MPDTSTATPPVAPVAEPPVSPPSAPVADQPAADPLRDATAIQKELEAANREAAKYRTELKRLQDAQKAADDAKLSDQERLTRERDEFKARLEAAEAHAKTASLRSHVVTAASRLGFADADDAMRFLDADAVEWKDDAPVNVGKLLDDVIKSKPYLRATRTQPPDHGAGQRGAAPGGGISDAQVEGWVAAKDYKAINDNWDAVQEYLKRTKGRG